MQGGLNMKNIVIADYKINKSIKSAARAANISESKARKLLISEGMIHYERTDALLSLMQEGLTIEQAAEKLNISPKVANSYLPYNKGEYNSDNPSINALRIRGWRETKEERK
jgi:molybdenum-dependent DNA-binding transcriptional regulator ModE